MAPKTFQNNFQSQSTKNGYEKLFFFKSFLLILVSNSYFLKFTALDDLFSKHYHSRDPPLFNSESKY